MKEKNKGRVRDTKDGVGVKRRDGWTADAVLDLCQDFEYYIDAVNWIWPFAEM